MKPRRCIAPVGDSDALCGALATTTRVVETLECALCDLHARELDKESTVETRTRTMTLTDRAPVRIVEATTQKTAREELWWMWHDSMDGHHSIGSSRYSTLAEAEDACAEWVAGRSDEGPSIDGWRQQAAQAGDAATVDICNRAECR